MSIKQSIRRILDRVDRLRARQAGVVDVTTLTFSRHAEWRMQKRGISLHEVHTALNSGYRVQREHNVVYCDLATMIGVVVNPKRNRVVTVMKLGWLPSPRYLKNDEA